MDWEIAPSPSAIAEYFKDAGKRLNARATFGEEYLRVYGEAAVSTGYYTFHTAGDGEPQKELFTRLMTEPGAYGQYTLRLLHEELAAAGKQIEKR